jgi:hypothetical protein
MRKRLFYEISAGQLIEFQRILAEAGFAPREVDSIIKEPELAKRMLELVRDAQPDRYPQFTKYLYSLEKQKIELRYINKQMAKEMRVPNAWFDNLDTDDGGHVQTVESLNFFYIEPTESLKEIYEYNVEIIRITQPEVCDTKFIRDRKNLVRHKKAHIYSPGIHRINTNLFDFWSPNKGVSVDTVRKYSLCNDVWLGAVEAIGAYGSQDPLFIRSQDGSNTHPYQDNAGLCQGEDLEEAPYFYWHPGLRKVNFSSYGTASVLRDFASSTVRECQVIGH